MSLMPIVQAGQMTHIFPYDIEHLLIAGGGSGGGGRSNSNYGGAGGGSGGYRTATGVTLTSGLVYTIVVGAGSAIGVNDTENPDNAGASSIKNPADGSVYSFASSGGGGGASREFGASGTNKNDGQFNMLKKLEINKYCLVDI